MGDHEQGGVEPPAHIGQNRALHDGIDCAGGVVEHEQPGRAHQGPGQSHPLALPARQGHTPLAHDRSCALREGFHELAGSRHAQRGAHVGPGASPAQVHVLGHRVGEQEGLLEHQSHRLMQFVGGDTVQVRARQPDRPPRRGVQPGDGLQQGGLARAGGADERHRLAGPHRQCHSVEHELGAVAHGKVVDLQAERPRRQDPTVTSRRSCFRDRLVEHSVHPLQRHHRAGHLLQEETHDQQGQSQQ